jgi:hypothetical protein
MAEKPTFAESDGCGFCDAPSANHGTRETPPGWRQSIGATHEYRAPTSRQVAARVAIREQQARLGADRPQPGEPARYVVVASPMAPPPEDPFVTEIEEMLYRILVNYEREGSGPGSRFEGKTLERCQAEQVIRHIRWHDSRSEGPEWGPGAKGDAGDSDDPQEGTP